jgi:hypothetical protein
MLTILTQKSAIRPLDPELCLSLVVSPAALGDGKRDRPIAPLMIDMAAS